MVKVSRLTLAFLVVWMGVWTNTYAQQKTSWNGSGSEVEFQYSGVNGSVSIWAYSPNYTYRFEMSAQFFQGEFFGTGIGFTNSWDFARGGHLSIIDANGAVIKTASGGEIGQVLESLSTEGLSLALNVSVTVQGLQAFLKVIQPTKPEPIFKPVIEAHYLSSEAGNVIGGYFENVGNAAFRGKIEFRVGLAYAQNWIAESVTEYAKGESDTIVIQPNDKLAFYFVPNPMGGWTFFFPTLVKNGAPLFFSVFAPEAESKSVKTFKDMIYLWWTGYHDPIPEIDYVNTKIRLFSPSEGWSDTLYFYHAISPYFQPPR